MNRTNTVCVFFANEVLKSAKCLFRQNEKFTSDRYLFAESFEVIDGRVPMESMCNYLHSLEKISQEDGLGFSLGRQLAPSGFSALGHLVMACPTIADAMRLVSRYHHLIVDCADVNCQTDEKNFYLYWRPNNVELPGMNVFIDLMYAAVRCFGIWSTGISESFSAVLFPYKKEHKTDVIEDLFGGDAYYQQENSGISFPLSWLEQPMSAASKDVQTLMEENVKSKLSLMHSKHSILEELRKVFDSFSLEGVITICKASHQLKISERTLQRQLKVLGTSFKQELKHYRLFKAKKLLKETGMSVSEIALSVGYAEHSSFTNAYKSWSGNSPIDDRKQKLINI